MPSPEHPSGSTKPPKADLGRLRIERHDEVRASPRGFPWLTVVAILGLVALGFLFRKPLASLISSAGRAPLRTARAEKIVPGQAASGDVSANGYIVADRQASLATVLSGRLVELQASEGDTVQQGAIVARIQYDDLESQQRQAEAAQASAKARLGQARAMTATARARVEEASKEEAAATLNLERLARDVEAQQDVVHSTRENRDRLQREVKRNADLYAKKLIDAGIWDQVQTAARTADLEVSASETRLRALQAAREAWVGQIDRRKAAWEVAKKDVLTAEQAEAVAAAAVAEAAEAETLARILLEKTRIRAPFTGMVIRKDAEKGEVLAPTGAGNSRGSVLTIIDPTSLEVQVELSERRITRVAVGDSAMVFLDADPDTALPARVRKIWPRADRSKGSIEVRVTFDTMPTVLRPDMAARVVFKGKQFTGPAEAPFVRVPKAALTRRSGSTLVFVVEGNVARGVNVETGESRDGSVVITSGLAGGELVLLDPPASLRSGESVETTK